MATKKKKTGKGKKSTKGKSFKVEYYEGTTPKTRRFTSAVAAKGFANAMKKLGKKVTGTFVFDEGASGATGFYGVK